MVMVRMIKKDNYVDGDSTSDDYEYGNDDGDNNSDDHDYGNADGDDDDVDLQD